MNKIIEVDAANLTAVVQPGVVIAALNSAVAPHGLIYPPDPGTVATATMGGSAAENSGGLRGLKYGVTKNYIMGMEVVLANGEKVRFGGKTVKNVTAYDFSNLFVGSEGTLGIITELTAKLIPAPKFRRTMTGELQDAGRCGQHGGRHHCRPGHSGHPGDHGPDDHPHGRGFRPYRPAGRRRGPAADRSRWHVRGSWSAPRPRR